jgi:hypothetical protein
MKTKKLLIAIVCATIFAVGMSSCTPRIADAIVDSILYDDAPPPPPGGHHGHGPRYGGPGGLY